MPCVQYGVVAETVNHVRGFAGFCCVSPGMYRSPSAGKPGMERCHSAHLHSHPQLAPAKRPRDPAFTWLPRSLAHHSTQHLTFDYLAQEDVPCGGQFGLAAGTFFCLEVLAGLAQASLWPGISLVPTSGVLHYRLRRHLRDKYRIQAR